MRGVCLQLVSFAMCECTSYVQVTGQIVIVVSWLWHGFAAADLAVTENSMFRAVRNGIIRITKPTLCQVKVLKRGHDGLHGCDAGGSTARGTNICPRRSAAS